MMFMQKSEMGGESPRPYYVCGQCDAALSFFGSGGRYVASHVLSNLQTSLIWDDF